MSSGMGTQGERDESPWKTASRERWDEENGAGDFDRLLAEGYKRELDALVGQVDELKRRATKAEAENELVEAVLADVTTELAEAEKQVDELKATLREIDTNVTLPTEARDDLFRMVEFWKHVAWKRREIARAALDGVREEPK